jgi:hypothetical protein
MLKLFPTKPGNRCLNRPVYRRRGAASRWECDQSNPSRENRNHSSRKMTTLPQDQLPKVTRVRLERSTEEPRPWKPKKKVMHGYTAVSLLGRGSLGEVRKLLNAIYTSGLAACSCMHGGWADPLPAGLSVGRANGRRGYFVA